jgi:hypothetical protein
METPQEQENASVEKSIKKLNVWLGIMVGFIVLYSIVMLITIDQKTEKALQMHPVVMIDPATLALTSDSYTNLIHPIALRPPLTTNAPTIDPKPMFEQKESYEIGDFVVVNFFYVETIIVEKLPKDYYRLMYKDHEHVLQTIDLHKQFLLAPTSYNVVSPVSLLVD